MFLVECVSVIQATRMVEAAAARDSGLVLGSVGSAQQTAANCTAGCTAGCTSELHALKSLYYFPPQVAIDVDAAENRASEVSGEGVDLLFEYEGSLNFWSVDLCALGNKLAEWPAAKIPNEPTRHPKSTRTPANSQNSCSLGRRWPTCRRHE